MRDRLCGEKSQLTVAFLALVAEVTATWGELFLLSYVQISQHLELQSTDSVDPYPRQLRRTQEQAGLAARAGWRVFFRQNSAHA